MVKLSENVYVCLGLPDGNSVSNSGIIVLERSVLVFDTQFTPEAAYALLGRIQSISSKPVRYVVNSHFHPDHTHGNQAFPKAQQLIASTNARRDILQRDQPAMNRMLTVAQAQVDRQRKDLEAAQTPAQKETLRSQIAARQAFLDRMRQQKIVVPVVTVDDTLAIADGSTEIQLLLPGAGHTEGDLVLFLPAEKIVFMGDLFFNAAFPNAQDANLLEWTKTLGEILRLDAEKFVPGHGAVGGKADVANFLSYLEELRALVEPAVARGDAVEQVVRDTQIPAKYASYGFQSFFPANLQKMYAELKAIQMNSPALAGPEAPKKSTPAEKPQP